MPPRTPSAVTRPRHASLPQARFAWRLLLLLLLACPLAVAKAEEKPDDKWQVSLTPSYTSGDYGQGSTTTVIYVPLSFQRLFRDGDISFVVPWVSVTGDCSVTLLSGVPNQTGSQCGAPHPQRGRKKRTSTPDPIVTNSGLGDLVLRGRYYMLDEGGGLPEVAVTARLKIPTAEADKGLGTGEFDEGFGIEVTRTLLGNWVGFVDAGYTFIGKPPGIDLRNQWYYDVGLGYNLTKDLTASMYYEEWRALLDGFQNPQDLLFSLSYTHTPAVRMNLSTQIGLSDGAPSYGLTGGVSLRF
ncbi:MAG: transporter [Nitrospirae bacterium]|nr:MAG: transporter [Nitrospirota bacterium]